MEYDHCIEQLQSLRPIKGQNSPKMVAKVLTQLGVPYTQLPCIHVTGTNGKGSTVAMVNVLLQQAGYQVGMFSSPHLFCWCERIQVTGAPVTKKEFVALFQKVMAALPPNEQIDFFSVLTAMALLHFFQQEVDIAVLEVGIGGRWDSTNVVEKSLAVLTNIDLEHTEILGTTKEAIAQDKVGILKPQTALITSEEDPAVLEILIKETQVKRGIFIQITRNHIENVRHYQQGQVFDFAKHKRLFLPFLHSYQLLNAALAITACEQLEHLGLQAPSPTAIATGLQQACWPLRFEIIQESPRIIVDVAHNLHGVQALVQQLNNMPKHGQWLLLMGSSYNKPFRQMAPLLAQRMDHIIISQASYRAAPAQKIVALLQEGGYEQVRAIEDLSAAVREIQQLAREQDTIFVFGGLFFGVEVRGMIASSLNPQQPLFPPTTPPLPPDNQ